MANVIFLAVFLIMGCGVGRKVVVSEGDKATPPVVVTPESGATYLTGRLSTLDLDSLRDRPLVLVFASDTCDICLAEAEEFRDSLKVAANPPTKVTLVTAMVGAVSDDALVWKEDNRIPWTVAIDENLDLFKQYCGGSTVPCTLVQLPGKGIVFRQIGAVHVKDLQKLTGPWE